VIIPGKDARLLPYGSTNLGMPLNLADELIVPNDRFFVRSNGSTPEIDAETWRLVVTGLVDRDLSLSLAALKALPQRTVTSWIECAGNGRSRYRPVAEGTTWRNDAIGNAVWTGTSLGHVLREAGIGEGAVEIVSQGADLADMRRGLPIGFAHDPNVMLVWEMNGEPLPAAHGGPVRLLVPGWGGIASTKWLASLEVIDRPFVGHYQGELYVVISPDGEKLLPVREMPVKSVIVTPNEGDTIAAGPATLTGFAWSGYGGITHVDVSVDGGHSWVTATIMERAGPLSWVRFAYEWDARPGETRLRARATDQRGLTQPIKATWNEKGYLMNEIHEVTITVTASPR
jgi:DMSO/TMAO reductase YedYZ molybdopterin-dependent catalytic subunit